MERPYLAGRPYSDVIFFVLDFRTRKNLNEYRPFMYSPFRNIIEIYHRDMFNYQRRKILENVDFQRTGRTFLYRFRVENSPRKIVIYIIRDLYQLRTEYLNEKIRPITEVNYWRVFPKSR